MREYSDANFGAGFRRVIGAARVEAHKLRRRGFVTKRGNGRRRQNETLDREEHERGCGAMLMVGGIMRVVMGVRALHMVIGDIAMAVLRRIVGLMVTV